MSEQTNADDATGGAPQGGTLTQAQADEFVQKRLAREKAAHEKQLAELQAKVNEFTTAEEQRKAAAMTELEKARAAAAEAARRIEAATAEAEAAKAETRRYRLVAEKASDLPALVRNQIAGNSDEEIEASIARLRGEWEELRKSMGQPPQSVGSPSAAPGGQPPVPPGSGPVPNTQLSPYEALMAAAAAEDNAKKG